MRFRDEAIEDFKALFEKHKSEIRGVQGCLKLQLLQDLKEPSFFCTYSWWESENDLNNYRSSDVFDVVWPATKAMFADKPEAWSSESLHLLD